MVHNVKKILTVWLSHKLDSSDSNSPSYHCQVYELENKKRQSDQESHRESITTPLIAECAADLQTGQI